jgi:nuclear pore complex protein Nup98-Nup96
MARFGLIDSDEEEVSDGESSSSQHSLLEEGGVGRETNQSRTSSSSSDFDFEQEDAPPRASLLSDDDDESQITSEEEEQGEGEGEDYSISFATRTPSPPPPTTTTTTTRQTRVKRGGGGGETPWAEQLKLEPKRVQVMQASFFGQSSNNPNPTASTPRSTVVQQQQQQQERVISVPTPIIDPQPFRPFRSYHRVALSDSIINDSGGSIIDAGSTLGRSYKIGWGSKGEIVSLESDDVLKISKLRLLEKDKDLDKKRSMRLLQLQLAHTEIYPSCHTDPESCTNPVPFASPLPTLRFHHFDKLFDTTTTTEEEEEEAQLFKLASHLFDEVNDLGLLDNNNNNKTNLITRLRRKDLLSNWLHNFLLPRVQLKLNNNNSNSNSLEKIFLLLTSHSLKLACETSLDSSNLRLASLISQIGTVSSNSTDSQFQTDLEKQLEKWKEFDLTTSSSCSLVSKEIVKIYELLSGNLENSQVLQGVEWKAAFAMVLWYSRHDEAQREEEQEEEVSKAIRIYENSWTRSNNKVAPPLPSYLTTTTTTNTTTDGPLDPIYHLIKLYTLPTHSLEESLSPLNFGNCSTDYRLPWHLYLMFSRVLRKRDFEDRLSLDDLDDLDDDDDMDQTRTREGNSVRADQITVSYASQLESLGMWEWSIFVLLHLELEIP